MWKSPYHKPGDLTAIEIPNAKKEKNTSHVFPAMVKAPSSEYYYGGHEQIFMYNDVNLSGLSRGVFAFPLFVLLVSSSVSGCYGCR